VIEAEANLKTAFFGLLGEKSPGWQFFEIPYIQAKGAVFSWIF